MGVYADPLYNRTGYDIISYFRSAFIEVQKGRNATPDGFESNFCGAAFFAWPNQLLGFLFLGETRLRFALLG